MKINLGSGTRLMEGYVNVDYDKTKNPDIIWNLEKLPLPFKDNSTSDIKAHRIIEHLHETRPIIKECCRIGKNGCKIEIIVPHYLSVQAWTDITHYRSFTGQSFDNLNLNPEYMNFPLRKLSEKYISYKIFEPFLNIDRRITELLFAKFLPIFEIIIVLEVVK